MLDTSTFGVFGDGPRSDGWSSMSTDDSDTSDVGAAARETIEDSVFVGVGVGVLDTRLDGVDAGLGAGVDAERSVPDLGSASRSTCGRSVVSGAAGASMAGTSIRASQTGQTIRRPAYLFGTLSRCPAGQEITTANVTPHPTIDSASTSLLTRTQ